MPTDRTPPDPDESPSEPVSPGLLPVAVIDESIREAFLLLDALDRRTLGSLTPPLTCAQYHALVALELLPGASLTALASKLLCAKANASGIVDRLGADKLVRKEDDPADARRIRVWLTPQGEAALAIAKRARHDALTAELAALRRGHDLSLDELARMMRLMVSHLRTTSVGEASSSRLRRPPISSTAPTERPRNGRPAKRGRARR
ncbi:MAG TPA: MarR family winged helix-turn-helix transcriptional regulator [Ktedonobacterales bacterium]|nr:MarR family winged helix-turn-helix transcriptional regulator [Ktedonobacterales bacterium]